ncbi:MAG TPA: protease inhibitor I42 family protein [Chthoniobacteraceae bacterium]|jgi:predicted secreted protein
MKIIIVLGLALALSTGCRTTSSRTASSLPGVALGPSMVNPAPQKTVTLSESERDAVVALKPNGTVILALQSNEGAGYRWRLADAPDETVLKLATKDYMNPVASGGATATSVSLPGTDRWVFKAAGKGTTEVRMVYDRPNAPLNESSGYAFTVNVE